MNNSCSTTPSIIIHFHTHDYGVDNRLIKTYFCTDPPCTMQCYDPKAFYHSVFFVNKYIFTFASHNQLHMNGISNIVHLFSSSPGKALHLIKELKGLVHFQNNILKHIIFYFF